MSTVPLATLALASFAAALVPTAAADAGDTCVNYAYVADYQWYYLCVAPKDASCPVYTKRVVGVTETRACVVGLDASSFEYCTPWTGDMDHQFRVCARSSVGCPVSRETMDGGRTCYG